MKQRFSIVLTILSLLVALVSIAAAPMASGTATLISVEFVPGKGPVFTFSVSGKFSKADLKGSLHVDGGANYDLYCTQVDDSTVKCSASKKAGGTNVVLSWGGSTFWTSVPGAPEFCYSVWDWNLGYPTEWVNYGTYCQDAPAEYGDMIFWYNPGWDSSWPYEFLPESPDPCSFHQDGDAYYYPACIN